MSVYGTSQRKFVRTTTLFGKQYDWWTVDGVLTLLPHVAEEAITPFVAPGVVVDDFAVGDTR